MKRAPGRTCTRDAIPRIAAVAFGLALTFIASAAPATPLTPEESGRLARGATVEHPQVLELKSGRYVGGTTYAILDASTSELDEALRDVGTYPRILPYTKDIRLLARDGSDLVVWLRQGRSFLDASYTVRIRATAGARPESHVVRFWIDRSRPHGIDDASGSFEYEPIAPGTTGEPRLLLTFTIWVDIGPGLVRDLFERRIQDVVLTVPDHLRALLAAADDRTPRQRSADSARAAAQIPLLWKFGRLRYASAERAALTRRSTAWEKIGRAAVFFLLKRSVVRSLGRLAETEHDASVGLAER